jgi:hypothetical protein
MSELNYKITQINEEWEIFNNRVTKMNIEYELIIYTPSWLRLDVLEEKSESFNNLELVNQEFLSDSNMMAYTYNICIPSISKCDITKDVFSEVIGVYLCETKAEIKILEKVSRVMNSIYDIIEKSTTINWIDDSITKRLSKNRQNLERLKLIK